MIYWGEPAYTGPRGDEYFTQRISILRVPNTILAQLNSPEETPLDDNDPKMSSSAPSSDSSDTDD